MTFAVEVSVIGGVSFAGKSCVRKGDVVAVSAISPVAHSKSARHNTDVDVLIGSPLFSYGIDWRRPSPSSCAVPVSIDTVTEIDTG
jgi:hypothetical protein